jgi:hypothetical protein
MANDVRDGNEQSLLHMVLVANEIVIIRLKWRNITLVYRRKFDEGIETDRVSSLAEALVFVQKEFFSRYPRTQEEFKTDIENRARDMTMSLSSNRQETQTIPLFTLTAPQLNRFQD